MKTRLINKKTSLILLLISAFLLNYSGISAQTSISFNSNKGKHKISVSNDRTDFKIEYEGEITLSDDEKDIKDISRGGYIEIKKSSFGKNRKIIIENDGGKLTRKFFIGWSEKDYYPEGKAWLADILPEILRSTTIGAKSRVDRFYKKGGANGVLNVIEKMESDFVQSAYFKLLLDKKLSSKEIVNVLKIAGNVLKSDHYLSSILKRNQQMFLKNNETINAYISAAKNIKSDHYLTQIVKTIVSNNDISDSHLESLLKISGNVNSDHYLSEILKEVMDKRDLNKQNMEQIMLLSKKINSDHYKTNILKKAIRSKNISKEAYASFLNSLRDINSDHYASEVIKELMNNDINSENLNQLLNIIKSNISSSHNATGIYKKMALRVNFKEDQLISILNAIKEINSSHDLSVALIAFAPQVKKSSTKVKDAYIKAAKSINSETYLGRAIKAIY